VKRIFRGLIVVIISNSLIFLPLVNANAAEGLALPASDLIAPEIDSPPITDKITPGERVTIHATVTDNVGVKNVTIFYRDMGENNFKREEMRQEPGTDDYSATLPEIIAPGIEYYIQATDQAGNTLLHGHTFAPLTLNAEGPPGAVAHEEQSTMHPTPQEAAATESEKGISKWVWIGLGVLAVGAIAASSGGSDGGTTTPTTGSITISAPPP